MGTFEIRELKKKNIKISEKLIGTCLNMVLVMIRITVAVKVIQKFLMLSMVKGTSTKDEFLRQET